MPFVPSDQSSRMKGSETIPAPSRSASAGEKQPVSPCFTRDEVERFHRDGYIIVRGLADDRMLARMLAVTRDGMAREIEPIEYEADLKYPGAPESKAAAGGRTIRRLKQAHARDYVFTEWMIDPPLLGRLRQIVSPSLVVPLAHHNCIMTKSPQFSSDTGWHQDIRYWSFPRPDLVSVWLALGSEREQNGCLWLIPGSHRMTFDRSRFDSELFFRADHPENQTLIATKVKAELDPGDVLFFHCRTLHAASRNFTNEPKLSVVLTVRSADNPPRPDSRSAASPEIILPPGEVPDASNS